jgi:hypothetical protein
VPPPPAPPPVPAPPLPHQSNLAAPPPPPPPPAQNQAAPAAHSECALSNFHFGLNGDEVTTQATSTGGAACKYHYFGDASTTITSASVIQQPSYGVLTQTGTVHFEYHPNAKFRGFDHYTTEVCGHGPSGVVNCSHINHEVTVQ